MFIRRNVFIIHLQFDRHPLSPFTGVQREFYLAKHYPEKYAQTAPTLP